MKRYGLTFIALVAVILAHATFQPARAKDLWTSVRSKNFSLVGNASEKEIRQVATKLEQFRYVFSRLLTNVAFNSPVPTTVIVFKSESYYKPYKVNPNVAGYFQPGDDITYITLTTEQRPNDSPYRIIFHEYVHQLVDNTLGHSVPLWFNEGLAEYYSTFYVTDNDRKAILGDIIANHVLYLRDHKILPLPALFAVDHKSPYYNEGNKMNVFYAESWMLLHFLLQGNEGKRHAELGKFLSLLGANATIENAFSQAFQTAPEQMEKEFKSYISGARYMASAATFKEPLVFDSELQTSQLTEAEAQAYLGDLLLHTRRLNDSETHLKQALTLDPNLPMAHASLGMLRFYQGRFDDARASLEHAVAANTQNYLAHYYYAYALSRRENGDTGIVSSYPAETVATMRAELKKAIALNPGFPGSYNLLAFVNLVAGEQLDEALDLLKHALKLSPGKADLVFMLGQVYLRQSDFKNARQVLAPLANSNGQPELSQRARLLLESLKKQEEQLAQYNAWKEANPRQSNSQPRLERTGNKEETTEIITANNDPSAYLRQALRQPAAGEVQIQGTLMKVECDTKDIILVIKQDDRLVRVKTEKFEDIDFTTYTPDVSGEISCGPRKIESTVIVCYVPAIDARARVDGVVKSLEFVPRDFTLRAKQ